MEEKQPLGKHCMSRETHSKPQWVPVLVIPLSLMGCSAPFLSVNETVVMEGAKTPLSAFVEREAGFDNWAGVPGVEVSFWVEEKEVARAVTDYEGHAYAECALPQSARRFEARADHRGRAMKSEGKILPWPKDRTIIVCDIDGTISWTDFEELVLHQSEKTSKPIEGSREVLHELSNRYSIIYLSARERFFFDLTNQWLAEQGFPEGPLLTSATLDEGIHAERFKRETILRLQRLFPNVLIGIGNKSSDVEAYGACGLVTLIRHEADDRQFRAHAIVLEDWNAIRSLFDMNREVLENPDTLRTAMHGGMTLVTPVFPYKKMN